MLVSLRKKLTTSHLAVISITAMLMGVGSYLLLVEAHYRNTTSLLQMVSKNIALHLDSFLTEKENHLREISESREVSEYQTTYRYDEMMDYFSHFKKNFSSLAYINVKGEEEVAMEEDGAPPEQLENFSDRPLFRQAMAHPGQVVSGVVGRTGRQSVGMALARIAPFTNKISCVLYGTVPLAALETQLAAFLNPGEDYGFIQDSDGRAVFGIVVQDLQEIHGEPLTGNGYASKNRLGVDCLYSAVRMTKLQWTVVSIVPSEAYAKYPDMLKDRAFMAFLVTCLLGTMIARWVSSRLTEPLFSLTRSARRIAAGESTERLPVSSEDEIGSLMQAFNQMAESLQQTTVNRDYVENIFQSLKECLLVVDRDGNISYANKTAFTLLQYDEKELLGCHLSSVLAKPAADASVFRGQKGSGEEETNLITKSGEAIAVLFSSSPIYHHDSSISGFVCLALDIRQRKQSEEEKELLQAQLQQAQRLETVGTLAGGIAHDFNNILTAIIGFSQLAKRMVEPDSPASQAMENALTASFRAKDLVKQLLSFSRRSPQEKAPLVLTPIIKEITKLLRATIQASIEIKTETPSELHPILADPAQIHQLIMNLCANAAQAMENGGVLTIRVSNFQLDNLDLLSAPDLKPGPYVSLSVCDTGSGIDPEIVSRIFDPFFTTKDLDKGTGLGLSVVHGIVKSHHGNIRVESKPGKGTVFTILLPAYSEAAAIEGKKEARKTAHGRGEHILFVDDEEALTMLAGVSLKNFGYQITAVNSSQQALKLFRETPTRFDLVVTDLAMPQMNGDKMAREILALRPEIPIILCTGYDNDTGVNNAMQAGVRRLLMKPYSPEELAGHIRQVMDSGKASTQPGL